MFGEPSYKIEGCPEHGKEELIEYLREKSGVYRMYQVGCEALDEHICDCDLCNEETTECNYLISWSLFDQIDEILSGYHSAPLVDSLITKKKILPHESYLRLFN